MVFRSTVQGDVIMLPPGVHLPDGTPVVIEASYTMPACGEIASFSLLKNGVPILPQRTDDLIVDLDFVNKLRDEAA